MRPDLAPTACLPFEPEEAHRLQWLPLAVRHKLDAAGLRMSLAQWQALAMTRRLELLRLPTGPHFAAAARRIGASPDVRSSRPVPLCAADVAEALGCATEVACRWLARATPFARYALCKSRMPERTVRKTLSV